MLATEVRGGKLPPSTLLGEASPALPRAPTGIRDTPRQAVILHHICNSQILNGDGLAKPPLATREFAGGNFPQQHRSWRFPPGRLAVFTHQSSSQLMQKVLAAIRNSALNTGYFSPCFTYETLFVCETMLFEPVSTACRDDQNVWGSLPFPHHW